MTQPSRRAMARPSLIARSQAWPSTGPYLQVLKASSPSSLSNIAWRLLWQYVLNVPQLFHCDALFVELHVLQSPMQLWSRQPQTSVPLLVQRFLLAGTPRTIA